MANHTNGRKPNGLHKGSLLERLRIRVSHDAPPPTPFDRKIRWIKNVLNIVLGLTVLLLIGVCVVPIEDLYVAEGVVRPGEYRHVYAPADLELREGPLVEVGQTVRQGEPLMRFSLPALDREILDTHEKLAEARADLALATAQTKTLEQMPLPKELWEMKEQLAESQHKRDYHAGEVARAEELAQSGDISQREVEQAKLAYEQAEIAHTRLTQRLEIVKAGYAEHLINEAKAGEDQIKTQIAGLERRLGVLQTDRERLSVLRAPADGVIFELPFKNVLGMVPAGAELLYMSVGDERVVEVFGDQRNFDRIVADQPVRYVSAVFDPMKFGYAKGRVVKISQLREPSSSGLPSDVGLRYSIIATIDSEPKELKMDSNVTAQITLRKDRLIKVLFGIE